MNRTLTALLLLAPLSGPAAGQEYTPRETMPDGGYEVLLVLVSTPNCPGNTQEGFDEAVRRAKVALQKRVESDGGSFYAIGAALAWDVEAGLEYLLRGTTATDVELEFGRWDEVSAGRNWMNHWSVDLIWTDDEGLPVVPQVVVLRRSVSLSQRTIKVGPAEILGRFTGADEIVRWAEKGLPLDF